MPPVDVDGPDRFKTGFDNPGNKDNEWQGNCPKEICTYDLSHQLKSSCGRD